jgi:AbiV family abortive infection protein
MSKGNPEYREIARLAYSNALDLQDEAKLLFEAKSPRAFTLAVASCEELVKCILAFFIWNEDIDPEKVWAERGGKRRPMLTDHTSKHGMFALFLFIEELRQERGSEAGAQVLKDAVEKGELNFDSIQGGARLEKFMRETESRRQASVYVGVKSIKGRVQTPKTEITPEICQDLLKRIEQFIPVLEAILPLDKATYRKWSGRFG